ncbi:nucleoside hydrolase [Prauserella muralis]|uniref:Uncharacterized protein n=1 Tax=Prauserella muralis TaxID=588067 RepID=A0A2V4ABI2_9PSEU|nr:nucleoside hydrolase [Prauserella muralis]PXY16506.1 hypothetical protein BAY60_35460 [Prauserella muralis]TWE11120.1 purine nucleosidase [Prauserella muralis]
MTRVYIDTDGGLDDALALAFLLRHPDPEVAAIGSVHGNVTAEAAARNSLRLLELLDTEVPVVVGADRPLQRELHLRHPDDPAAAILGPAERATPATGAAAERIVQLAHESGEPLSLLMIGPLTNLALALRQEPHLPTLVGTVIAMGGAFHCQGNITPHAESNIWHDPDAAAEVLAAGFADLTFVGLDVTRHVQPTTDWLRALADDPLPWGPYAHALAALPAEQRPPLPLHDPLAAAVLLAPDITTRHSGHVTVELTDDEHRGHTSLHPDPRCGTRVHVAAEVDATAALQVLLHGLSC